MIVHGEELGDRIVGIMGGYIRWSGLVEDSTMERACLMGVVLDLDGPDWHGCTYQYLNSIVNIDGLLQSVAEPQTS